MISISARTGTFWVLPIILVNKGASNGPRIATVTFESGIGRRPRLAVRVTADIDGAKYQDESGVRRRAGRAAVPVGRRASNLIANGTLRPSLRFTVGASPWAEARWSHSEEFEGFGRVVTATANFRAGTTITENLTIPEDLLAQVAGELKALSDGLHASIDDSRYIQVFGGQ